MQGSKEEGLILKKENKEEGRGEEEDGNGWMDGAAEEGRGIIMPDTTQSHGMEEGRNREDDLAPAKC